MPPGDKAVWQALKVVRRRAHAAIVGARSCRVHRSMKLSDAQKRHLRSLGHHLKPVVWVGQHGLKDSVIAEIELALDSHELIKVKIAADRESRNAIAADICSRTAAEPIHTIGQMLILFRRNEEKPRIALPSS